MSMLCQDLVFLDLPISRLNQDNLTRNNNNKNWNNPEFKLKSDYSDKTPSETLVISR